MNECHRCHGFLFSEYWPDMKVVMNRCLNCGDITDEVILINRFNSRPPAYLVAEVLLAELRGSPAP